MYRTVKDLITEYKVQEVKNKMNCYECIHHETQHMYGGESYNKCLLKSTPDREHLHDNDGCEKREPDFRVFVSDDDVDMVEYVLRMRILR